MNRRDVLALITSTSAFIAGCSGEPDSSETELTTRTETVLQGNQSENLTSIDQTTTAPPSPVDSEPPRILESVVSYLDAGTLSAVLVGEDNVGIASARIQTSIDSVEKQRNGVESIELEARLDATLREMVQFIVEDQHGNRREVTRSVCFDAELGMHLIKDGQPMELGWDEPEIVEQSGQYYLFYRIGGGGDEIAIATSRDGVNWTKGGRVIEQGAGDAWDNNYVISPAYLQHNGRHYVFYEGNDGHVSRIGWAAAEQIEGPYQKSPDNPILVPRQNGGYEDVLVGTPAVSRHDNGYVYLYYHGWDAEHDRLAVARSEDIVDWEKSPNNPIVDVESGTWYSSKIAPSDVVRRAGTDYVLVEGDDGQHWRSGLALAENPFTNVHLVDYNPILGLGQTGAFDDTHAHTPSGILTETDGGMEFWLYYQGNNGSAYRLSRATQPVCQ